MKSKLKKCHACGEDKVIWKNINGKKHCKECAYKEKLTQQKTGAITNHSTPKKKSSRKPTGELKLFLHIYSELNGICEITGKQLPFSVDSFMHVLSKGAYPTMRLSRANLMFVDPLIHHLYDNEGKEKLLAKYPAASIIYERKLDLKYNYYNN